MLSAKLNALSRAALIGGLALVALAPAAYAADAIRVRGTVISLDGTTLNVKTREGKDQAITLAEGWKVSSVAAASANDIKAGDYVGIASLPTATGGNGALEVLIFPKAMSGANQGSFPWDLQPGSSMTNATVADAVTGVNGRSVTVSYQGGTKQIDIPEATPIVTFADATVADIVAGATVFVPAEAAADGTVTSHQIVVGTNGVVPPM